MGVDRPDDFEAGDSRYPRPGDQRGDIPAARSGPAETRTREEYYEVLRAADGPAEDTGHETADERHEADGPRTGPSGWNSVDTKDRPPLDALRVSDERRAHILDGDASGGGHRHGVGKPHKTEFPASWDDEKIIANVLDVARKPDKPPTRQDWNDSWLCTGTRDNVDVWAVVERNGNILTGWPEEGGPGVVRNPRRGNT